MPRSAILHISAASSLTDVFGRIGNAFAARNPRITLRFNFGASGTLLRQIQNGAPVDLFASASLAEMKTLLDTNQMEAGKSRVFATNRLALIVPRNQIGVHRWGDLALPLLRHIAISDPTVAPSGKYAKTFLEKQGIWVQIEGRLVRGQNARQTLTYVTNGDTDAGIVFLTDALLETRRVRVVATAGIESGIRPVYAVGILRNGSADSELFYQFLQSEAAHRILKRFGFGLP